MRDDNNTSIPYTKSVAAIKATHVREDGVASITVQKKVSILNLMKANEVTPYELPGKKKTARAEKERLTSDEEANLSEYHDGPQISSPEEGENDSLHRLMVGHYE